MAVVIGVTAFALYYVMPTLHYFMAVSGKIKETPARIDELRTQSVPLGLDLQGGVDVLLAIDVEKTRLARVEEFAEYLKTKFRQESPAVAATLEVTSSTAAAAAEEAAPEIVLTVQKPEQARTVDNILMELKRQEVFPEYQEGSVKAGEPIRLTVNAAELRRDLESTVDSAWKVLHERVDALGVTQPVVVRQGADRIRVQIPGEKDPQRVVRDIIRPAVLEFKGVYEGTEAIIDPTTGKAMPGKTIPPGYMAAPFKRGPQVGSPAPSGPQPDDITWMLVRRRPEMTGASVKDARVTIGQSALGAQEMQVSLEFNAQGADQFAKVTGEYIGKPLAIVLDGTVYSAPVVQNRITGGSAQITGSFTPDEAKSLSLVLKAGALPAELRTLDQRTVEATLGADSIRASVQALALGSVLVAIAMILYYGMAGMIAVVAVLINVLLIFAFMRLAGATLTLSGIGGILLTVGMAVDANVLIYERIREELKAGRGIKQAVSLGFNRAFSVIFDGNLTTLISGLTLLQFGEGSVKGFALALNVGILATLFTGLFCTRTLVEFWLNQRGRIGVGKFQWLRQNVYLDFIKLRKFTFVLSLALFGASVLYLAVAGPNWGVDFSGGVLSEIQTSRAVSSSEVQGNFGDWRIQKVGNATGAEGSRFIVRMKVQENQELPEVRQALVGRLDQTLGAGQYQILGTEGVSNEVGEEFTWKAILATIVASILLLIYIAMRFEFSFGVAAVIALFHDVLITFGLFNILSALGLAGEVTLDVVAALLVVLGYSVNDTIIIFDRIRENRRLHPGLPMKELINRSICESLNRTIMTGGTVLIVLIVMLIMGGPGLYDFALVLLLGVIKGTYSSNFVAAPIVYELYLRARRKGGDIIRPAAADSTVTAEQGH